MTGPKNGGRPAWTHYQYILQAKLTTLTIMAGLWEHPVVKPYFGHLFLSRLRFWHSSEGLPDSEGLY